MRKYIRKAKNFVHFLNAVVANLYYRFPSRSIQVIGITGTDGKTTTSHMVYNILKAGRKKVSMISTIYAIIGGKESDTGFHVTSPNPWMLQKLIRQAVSHGDEYLILEVTSHGLDQNRVWGIPFAIGVLTNITNEHLDYHGKYSCYLATKFKLLQRSKTIVVNNEDKSYLQIPNYKLPATIKITTYGLKRGDTTLQSSHVSVGMSGNYNKSNALAAFCVGCEVGIADKTILLALKNFKGIIGRLEKIYDNDFAVIIDFAHTPNGLLNVLQTVCDITTNRLILVFGCAGKRDIKKRPVMGAYAAKYADVIILTEEDYRDENVESIMDEIEKGIVSKVRKNKRLVDRLYRITDRQEAVNKAISLAKKGDVVLLTGKGHEKSLCRGDKEYPWSEHLAVKKALKIKA